MLRVLFEDAVVAFGVGLAGAAIIVLGLAWLFMPEAKIL